jgi:hypothetical protein
MSGREAEAAALSAKVSDVVERQRRRGASRRRRRGGSLFSRSGGEAQETEKQRKKTMVWGKEEKFTPAPLFIYRQVRVVGVVVLHYPDSF